MKKPALIIMFLILVTFVLSVTRMFVSNRLSTSGVELGKVQEEIGSYKLQNALLAQKYYETASLSALDEKATELGYVEKQSEFVLSGQLPVAIKQ